MNIITILPNGAVVDGELDDHIIEQSIRVGEFQVLPSERMGTWFDNVGFMGNINDEDKGPRNESATRLHVAGTDRQSFALYGPAFVVGIDGRSPKTLPAEVTVDEINRLIELYADH